MRRLLLIQLVLLLLLSGCASSRHQPAESTPVSAPLPSPTTGVDSENLENEKPESNKETDNDYDFSSGEGYTHDEGVDRYLKMLSDLEKARKENKISGKRFYAKRCSILLGLKDKCPQMSEARKKAYSIAMRDYNRLGKYWDQRSLMNIDIHKGFILKNGFVKKGSVVADIGCGEGDFLFFFADRVGDGGKAYGVDIDPFCLDFLRNVRKKREYKNLSLVKSVPNDVMLPPESVDFVFVKGVDPYCLGNVKSDPKATGLFTQSINRALKKKGILYIFNNAETEEYVDDHLVDLISLVKKNGSFKLKYEFQKLNGYVLVFEKT